ncbi:MAG TPA: glycerate kinase [Pseudonocardiaceae bacterium]|nr:glycerate kinase [Pseudonocardiaceae bacterium]
MLVAPDKFKGSLTAEQVATAIVAGIHDVRPGHAVRTVPVADGGDGTVDAALAAGFTRVDVSAHGPTGEPVEAAIAVRDGVAVVETAAACGLVRLPGGRRAPMTATSFGAGDLVRAALDAGCRTIVLGVGGSASTDGGAGMLQALGAGVFDAGGVPLPFGGGSLGDVARVDMSTVDGRLVGAEIVLACDVDNPLLGPTGAAATFGPQKGADPGQVRQLDQGLARWAKVLGAATGRDAADAPGAGAAGGIGYAALAGLGAVRRPGIELLLELVGFDEQLAGAELVITGEGSLDEQTLHGKAPAGVADAARRAGIPVVAVAGRCLLTAERLREAGIAAAYPLSDLEPDPTRSMANAEQLVRQAGARIARDWLGA